MSDIVERYKELSSQWTGGLQLPHRDAAILTLAEVINRWFEKVTYVSPGGNRVIDVYDNSREA